MVPSPTKLPAKAKGDSQARQRRSSFQALGAKKKGSSVKVVNEVISGMLPFEKRDTLQKLLDGSCEEA